ncbi:hypothetical protein CC80DRAFT_491037 [Byssothecium circinans]|uniref:Knr4/Smi1-like domain-containing protein n=1 Tax=Byssothecium circinans TaxID=147558 RepID=A0A6A5U1F4_9PLEO|nr:hypothetical protein CC80DRAFT_491037 [Byssothecium circinans]
MRDDIKFVKDDILYAPSLPVVYHNIRELAKELAVLGKIDIASKITDLLLSQNRTDDGFRQMRFLNFAFEQTGDWPSAIPKLERSKKALDELEIPPSGSLDEERYDEIINRKLPSLDLPLCLTIAVVLCEKQGKTSIEEIQQDEKVVRALEQITEHFPCCIGALIEQRKIWPLLATGVLAQQLGADDAKLCAAAEDVLETVRIRIEEGRQKGDHEGRPIKELLEILVENTKKNAGLYYKEARKEPPESYLHKPATEKDIKDLEKRLNVSPLPDDYKEFLLASNGLEEVWDGHWMTPALHNTQNVELSDGPPPVEHELELIKDSTGTEQLIREATGFDAWPSATKQVEIGRMNEHVYTLLSPSDVKATIKAYKEALASDKVSDGMKAETSLAIECLYGSMEAFEKLEWVMMYAVDIQPMYPIGTFRNWLEEAVRQSARPDTIGGDPCLVYECRAKRAGR